MNVPPLGWIEPQYRTQEQHDAHFKALGNRVAFTIPFKDLPKGTKIILTDVWKHPTVISDIGKPFTGFGQHTGSCVGVSTGNAEFTLAGVQRLLTEGATKAFIPFWPFNYGRCRYREGDRGQGEGAVDSVMGQTIHEEGTISISHPDVSGMNLPAYQWDDNGLWLSGSSVEYTWSDGAYSGNQKLMPIAKNYPVGGIASLSDPSGIIASVSNGYPVLDGCSKYVGNGSIVGSGDTAYVKGHYDGSGGHSTCFLGVWNHPNDGYLFLYSNQWPTSTYPRDPAGGGRCCVWITESEVAKLFSQYGGNQGETMALSHLTYFPAQPTILDWFV